MEKLFGKSEWSALFADLGLSEAEMWRWHRLFEARHPEDHARFLTWLGLTPEGVAQVRSASREEQA